MSEIKVNSIKGVGASAAAITVNNTDGTCTANITNKPNRNLIINGAMQVAQRGTSATTDGYKFLDRWQTSAGNLSTGQNVVRSQQSLSSSDTGSFEAGFRKYARIATGAAGTLAANSYLDFYHHIEAQNIANSGWDYTSASSFITVSFWLRVSTNQTFYLFLRSRDGTNQSYVTPITASANNTWTKITKTIPGNSNIVINDDNGSGLTVAFLIAYGSDFTDNGKAINTWAAHSSSTHSPDVASTWLTAGASTFDVTGVQLEVGSVATDFEHRSFGQELALCQRYFQTIGAGFITACRGASSSQLLYSYTPPVNLRASPTISTTNDGFNGTFGARSYRDGSGVSDSTTTPATNSTYFTANNSTIHLTQQGFSVTDDRSATVFVNGGAITLTAEL
jgi:hypothetical protein